MKRDICIVFVQATGGQSRLEEGVKKDVLCIYELFSYDTNLIFFLKLGMVKSVYLSQLSDRFPLPNIVLISVRF